MQSTSIAAFPFIDCDLPIFKGLWDVCLLSHEQSQNQATRNWDPPSLKYKI